MSLKAELMFCIVENPERLKNKLFPSGPRLAFDVPVHNFIILSCHKTIFLRV